MKKIFFSPGILILCCLTCILNPLTQNRPQNMPGKAMTGTKPTVSLTVSGTIKNFKEFETCAKNKGAYIQLVRFNEGRVSTLFGNDGSVRIYSDLDVWEIPKNAEFSFSAPKIVAGDKYFLVFQKTLCDSTFGTSPYNTRYSPFFLKAPNTVFIIDIPADAKSPFIVKADLTANIH